MKKNSNTDKICIEKILRYVGDIRECFEHYDIKNYKDLESKRLAQYALTQIITNIHEMKKKMTDDVLLKLPELGKIRLANARNIASHDYDRIDFEIIYNICKKQILSDTVHNELTEVMKDDEDEQDGE